MTIDVTGAQIVGFILFSLTVGPALIGVGYLLRRVRNGEDYIKSLMKRILGIESRLLDVEDKILDRMEDNRRELSDKIEENSYKNCPVITQGGHTK